VLIIFLKNLNICIDNIMVRDLCFFHCFNSNL